MVGIEDTASAIVDFAVPEQHELPSCMKVKQIMMVAERANNQNP
jgi:hypothetical protein